MFFKWLFSVDIQCVIDRGRARVIPCPFPWGPIAGVISSFREAHFVLFLPVVISFFNLALFHFLSGVFLLSYR